jgi:hypothetical protein
MPEPADTRAVRGRLLGEADRFSDASADGLAELQRLARDWPGESGKALRRWVDWIPEQDHLHLARIRDITHNLR